MTKDECGTTRPRPTGQPPSGGRADTGTAAARLKAALAGTKAATLPSYAVGSPEKIPYSIYGLAHGIAYYASSKKERDFGTLDEVDAVVRSEQYREAVRRDRSLQDNVCANITDDFDVVVLDVEPCASTETKELVAGCDEALFVERSLSGGGLHAWIPRDVVDEIAADYPNASGKPVWRMAQGEGGCPYELLIRHQAISTGIPAMRADATGSIVPLLRDLASRQLPPIPRLDANQVRVDDVSGGAAIAEIAARRIVNWEPSQVGQSERDCAVATMAAGEVERMGVELTPAERVAVVERAATLWLEAHGELRDKWGELHYADGSTYSRGTAIAAVSLVLGNAATKRPWPYFLPSDPDWLDATAAVMAIVSLGAGAASEFAGDVAEECGLDLEDLDEGATARACPNPEPMGGRGGKKVARDIVDAAASIGLSPGLTAWVAQAAIDARKRTADAWSIEDTKARISQLRALRGEIVRWGDA